MNKLLLEGKTAIITGGSKGIGKATADLFVSEGANVVITARGNKALNETTDEIKAKGYPGQILGVIADSSKEGTSSGSTRPRSTPSARLTSW